MSSYSLGHYLGVFTGFCVSIVIVILLMAASKSDHSLKCKYDERQERVRGKAFKLGFFVLLIYNFLYLMFGDLVETVAPRHIVLIFGICFSAAVYVSYAIWNDGYFSLNEKPRRVIAMLAAVSALNFAVGARNFLHNSDSYDIMDGEINIICGSMVLAVFIVMLIKQMRGKDEGPEE